MVDLQREVARVVDQQQQLAAQMPTFETHVTLYLRALDERLRDEALLVRHGLDACSGGLARHREYMERRIRELSYQVQATAPLSDVEDASRMLALVQSRLADLQRGFAIMSDQQHQQALLLRSLAAPAGPGAKEKEASVHEALGGIAEVATVALMAEGKGVLQPVVPAVATVDGELSLVARE